MKHARELFWHYWIPVLVMLAVITFESTDMMSGAHTVWLLRAFLARLGVHWSGRFLELLNHVLRKAGHMVGYGSLFLCWLLLIRGSYWVRHEYKRSLQSSIQVQRLWFRPVWGALALLCTFFVAAADELHQMSIPSRTGRWADVALDTSAGFIVLLLFWAKAAWRCRQTRAELRGD